MIDLRGVGAIGAAKVFVGASVFTQWSLASAMLFNSLTPSLNAFRCFFDGSFLAVTVIVILYFRRM